MVMPTHLPGTGEPPRRVPVHDGTPARRPLGIALATSQGIIEIVLNEEGEKVLARAVRYPPMSIEVVRAR